MQCQDIGCSAHQVPLSGDLGDSPQGEAPQAHRLLDLGEGTLALGTGTFSELTNGSGQVTLVTPTYVLALGNKLPIFTSFTIHVLPEPGTLLLLGSGVLGLAFYGRRRTKK